MNGARSVALVDQLHWQVCVTPFTTTHIIRMKQLFQWSCSLVDNVPFAPFGGREFDFLMCDFFSHSPPFPPAIFTDVLWTFGHIT